MKVDVMDFQTVKERGCHKVVDGIAECYKNEEYREMEFDVIPRKDEIILLSHTKSNYLYDWKVVDVYHFYGNLILLVRGLNKIVDFK